MGYENSGRRPSPAELKLLRGNPSKTRVVPDLQAPEGEVVKPSWLSEGASTVWDETAPVCLEMRTLTAGDVRPFAAFCELYAMFIENVRLKGTAAWSGTRELSVANALRPYFEYFGMTMYARARLAMPKAKEEPAPKWAGQLT